MGAMETAASGRQLAQYMALSEYEGLWTEVVVKLRACIENVDGKSTEDLFDHIAGSDITVPEGTPGSEFDTITTAEVQTFLTGSGCEVELPKLDKLFGRGLNGEKHVGVLGDSVQEKEAADSAQDKDAAEQKQDVETEKTEQQAEDG